MWRVENRGENLIEEFIYPSEKDKEIFRIDDRKYLFPAYPSSSATTTFAKAWLKKGVTYTIKLYLAKVPSNALRVMLVLQNPFGTLEYIGPFVLNNGWNFVQYTASENGVYTLMLWLNTTSGPTELYYPMVYEGTEDILYVPPLQQSLESSLELFGYNGVYDEITSDGLVVKRWTKINIDWTSWATTSYKGRVSDDSGWQVVLNRLTSQVAKRMSKIAAVKYDGVPLKYVGDETEISSKDQVAWGSQKYFYVVSISDADSGWNSSYEPSSEDIKRYFNGWKYVDGTTWQGIGSSATADATTALNYTVKDIDPDADWKPYVVIYQLATPDIQKLDYSGELILYSGKNYLVTDSKTPIAISIKGAKKYLEG